MVVDWTQFDWDDLVSRLLFYAHRRMRSLGWRGESPGRLPPDLSPEDAVQAAIVKTLTGQRKWSPEEGVKLFEHLVGVIRSDLGHLAQSWENRALRRESDANLKTIPERASSPEERTIQRSELYSVLEYLEKQNPQLAEIVRLMIKEEIFAPAKLSERLGCSLKNVYLLKRQLKRSLAAYRAQSVGDLQ